MNHILLSLTLSSIIWSITLSTTPSCIPFDYSRDMSAMQSLLRTEWKKLFLSSSYDDLLVRKIFYRKQPGDSSASYTSVNIKVLYENDQLVGFITYYPKKNHIGHIELLAIDTAYRKKGYGTLLLDEITHELKNTGCTLLQLYVYISNPRAITFYEHMGFATKANFGSYLLLSKEI